MSEMTDCRTILAVTDFSASSTNAAWRAAMVAAAHKARLGLLHVVPARAPVDAARGRLATLAAGLRRRFGIDVSWHAQQGDALAESVKAARGADLLVIGTQRRNVLASLLLGTPAERLIRMARVPVLVVKREAEHGYRRVLVPVQLAEGARSLVGSALNFARGAEVEVFHALGVRHEISMRAADVPEPVLRRSRNLALGRARASLDALIDAAGGQPRARSAVGFGHAAAVAVYKEAVTAPDLVVIGKRKRSVLADFFLGSVTQRMLADSRADVLVLPVPMPARAIGAFGLLCYRPPEPN
jgi:nucleotide-binding universal stress UspA family protein